MIEQENEIQEKMFIKYQTKWLEKYLDIPDSIDLLEN